MKSLITQHVCNTALAVVMIALMSLQAQGDVVLTFDLNPTGNFVELPQDYGDRVTASPDSNGYLYDIVGGNLPGGTPNVLVEYGSNDPQVGDPSLWTTGYGDLTDVYYNEADGDDSIQIMFLADPGFQVGLFSFDVASFASGLSVEGLEVRNGGGDVLWSMGVTPIASGMSHNTFDLGAGVFGNALILDVDLSGLGGSSDNIGIDNVQFGQQAGAIPEPGAAALLLGMGLILLRRRQR